MTISIRSLRQRLLLTIIVPLCAISAIGGVVDFQLARETADAAFDQSLADAALDIASDIEAEGVDPQVHLSSEAEALLRSDPSDAVYFAVRDANGTVLAGEKDLAATGNLVPGDSTIPGQLGFVSGRFRETPVRAALYRVNSPRGVISITVAETLNKRNRISRRITTTMLLPGAAAIIATVLVVYFGVRRGLAPLDQVEREIATRSPRDLREIDIEAVPREIRPLLARLNELFSLLRAAAASQQRFLADAAHQLRTPLTGLQTQIELATTDGGFDLSSERLRRVNEATHRIGHLVDQLLAYARTDSASSLSGLPESVALDALVEQSASLFLDPALGKGIDIGFDPGPATVKGVPWMIREALANLIDNAIRYTPPGGVVTVSSGATERGPGLTVEDNGPGIPNEEVPRVIDRFYRIPGSPGNGCGLGLAIVMEVAKFHGAILDLERHAGVGLRASLIFPPPETSGTT